MPNSKICPKCNKSRETVRIIRKDPAKKGRLWKIEICPSCAWNFDLEEVKSGEDNDSEDDEEPAKKRYNWRPFGRWGP